MSKESLCTESSGNSPFSVSHPVYSFIKRAADVVLSVALLLLLSPLLLLVCCVIKLTSCGPVIFKQRRVGKNSRSFTVYKFRTMLVTAPKNVATQDLCDPDSHLTCVGKLLRRTSIDELPQIFNVLLGDMSFIGPRPLILAETKMHKMREEFGVYTVRPGMTGLAQINGRDNVTDEQKLEFDCRYLRKFGLWQDLYILVKSLRVVLSRKDIAEGTTEEDSSSPLIEALSEPVSPPVSPPVFERKKVG
ncbi:MAG TPA: sugar transferase [Ruminococcaceae bacterium]|nr:sugar transferase [Oscillospiraceae bacterium]